MNTPPLRLTTLSLLALAAGWIAIGSSGGGWGASTWSATHSTSPPERQTALRIKASAGMAQPSAALPSEVAILEIPVTGGVTECLIGEDLPAWYDVVIGSLGPGNRAEAIHLAWETLDSSQAPESIHRGGEVRVGPDRPGTRWRRLAPSSADSFPGRMAQPAVSGDAAAASALAEEYAPASERSFHFPVWTAAVGGGEWRGKQIAARLLATHARVRVYVDRQDVDHRVSSQAAKTVAVRLAEVALPVVESWLGPITDVDRDGGLSVLVTSEVEQLPRGSEPLRAFVRSADLEAGPRPDAGGSDGPVDIIYLNANRLSEGGKEGILTHEATHLAVFSRRREAGLPLRAEEWIDEGLAHAVEWLGTGDSRNLESRWAAFRAAPQGAALEVNCRAGSVAWRQADSRGATALFFSHLVQRQGVATLPRIAIARNSGRAAVSEGAGTTFDMLFRDWTVWEAIAGSDRDARPLPRQRGQQNWLLPGTVAVRFPLGPLAAGKRCRLRLEGPEAAALQLTLVRHGVPTSATSESSQTGEAATATLLRQ